MTDKPDTKAIRAQMEALDGHTAGPWFSSNQPGDWGLGGAHHIHTQEANPYEWDQSICHVEYQTPYCLGEKRSVIEAAGLAAANARLIAAAPDMHDTIQSLCDEVDRLRAENERLRRALAPFSEESAYWFSHNYNREDRPVEGFPGYTPVMTCGDLFNARAALTS